jgi:hypothetical protein
VVESPRVDTTPSGQDVLPTPGEAGLEGLADRLGDLPLDHQDIPKLFVVALRPQVVAVRHIDQLRRNPHPVARPANTPLNHVGDVKRFPDLTDRGALALESEGRRPGRHTETGHTRQGVEQLFADPVAEVLVLRIRTQILERQHGNREPRRRRSIRFSRCTLHFLRRCALDTGRRNVERPGEHDGDRKAEDGKKDNQREYPTREVQARDSDLRGLPDDESDDGVDHRHAVHLPALQLGQEATQNRQAIVHALPGLTPRRLPKSSHSRLIRFICVLKRSSPRMFSSRGSSRERRG